jgi:N-acetylmuramoyl-L-alanine amidase
VTGTTLLLDPGHGGASASGASSANRGRSATGLLEKDLALDLARRVRDRLTAEQVVVLTRDSDTNLTLAARAEAARRLAADVFVSLHFSGQDAGVDRTDAVISSAASPASRRLAETLRAGVAAVTGAGGQVLTADLGQLAADRHDPRTAVCLLEVASLAPPARAAQLGDTAYVNKLADAVAGAIRQHVRGTALATPQWVGMRYGRAAEIYPPAADPEYNPLDLAGAIRHWLGYAARQAQWSAGVPNSVLRRFPHAAICQLKLTYDTGGQGYGTGFYIADNVLLSAAHVFHHMTAGTAVQVEVQPAYSPNMSILPSATFTIDGSTLVHPNWKNSWDWDYDLAVLQVPGLPATAGVFNLANMSLGPQEQVVVCGYGKVDGVPFEDQGQRMDGARIARADWGRIYYPIMTKGGHSGSPVFHGAMVVAVHSDKRDDLQLNQGCLLTPDKNDWIVLMAGGGVSFGQSLGARALTVTSDSTQQEQSDQVRLDIARSVGLAEAGLQYHLVHDDSNRVNFGIGSWTGTRVADVLDTYAAYAAEQGLTPQLLAPFPDQAGFDAIRTAFRTNGTATVLTAAQRTALADLGRVTALQPAQDRHLANDLRADLDFIGNGGPPWYPWIDGYMNAVSEIAAHVLVHALHQSGNAGFLSRITETVTHFGGEAALGQAMVAGTVTERMFLEQVGEAVAARVQAQYQAGVRARYARLFTDWGASTLSYYFTPR